MKTTIRARGEILGRASAQLLSNNIETYENTVPCMLSDRLRNSKFSGPENSQTGIAAEWEPIGNGMGDIACRLIPGMYLSGREAQQIMNITENRRGGILQAGVMIRTGEIFEVELWARAQHRPVSLMVELHLPGQIIPDVSRAEMLVEHAHWHRYTCRLFSPGEGSAWFKISLPGESRIIIDQIHLRPEGESHVSQALLDSFNHFPCPVLRFPGGCVTCTYHWEHGVGPVHLRPVCDDPVFKYKLHYDFGTDEYLALCAEKGIRPFITLNTTTATPEEAAAWAAYVRAWYSRRQIAIPVAYFMFGNENYGTWEIGHMTGKMYAAQLREFVPAVRAAYPEAKMLAIGEFESSGQREAHKNPWRSTVIEEAAGLFDMLVVTRYAWASDSTPLAEGMQTVVDRIAEKVADLEQQLQSIKDAGLNCTIGIVEWNYWTRASHNDHAGFYEPNDIRHCLYAAGLLNAFCRLGERLEVANYYSLINTMGMIHVKNGESTLSDMVKVFTLYSTALPGEVLALEVDCEGEDRLTRMLDVNFIRTKTNLSGFLVNFSATETLHLTLEGLGVIKEACGICAKATLTPVDEFTPVMSRSAITLPPMSLIRVQMNGES